MNIILVSGDSRLDATTLEFNRDGQKYQGELAWVFENGQAKSALFRAQGTELGNILRVNEDEPLLEAASGRFVSNLTWEGSPLGFSVLTSEGLVELSLEDGRFVDLGNNSAEVLRLFGILNIETITRRLRLDFLDLVQPGVAFDRVSAKAKIANGSLRFDPEFQMKGPHRVFG